MLKTTLIFIFHGSRIPTPRRRGPAGALAEAPNEIETNREIEKGSPAMLVCHCRGISDRQIRRAIKDGATSVREVARETGAGMRCGGCRSNVKRVVSESLAAEFENNAAAAGAEIVLPTVR